MKTYPHNVKTIKSENRALIFNYLRRKPTSRAEISKGSGMSKSAVTMITNELIHDGQIVETNSAPSARGRKSILLDIVADYRVAAGISLHRKHIYVCIVDLKSRILAYASHKTSDWNNPYRLMDDAYREICGFLEELNIPKERCLGIGVSAPGPLDYVSGVMMSSPEFELFHNVDVRSYLQNKSGMPVMLDNNAVLLAMQQSLSNQYPYKNFIFVVVSNGIGSAVINNGAIYRGFRGFAGELGHTSIHANGIPCSCGNAGCLEKYISIQALQEKFGIPSYEKMVDDAYMGDHEANRILEYIADEFSCALGNAINLFDPDGVIIYGQFSYRPEKLFALLQEKVNRRSVITRTHPVEISYSRMQPDEASASVCSAIINRYFEQKL